MYLINCTLDAEEVSWQFEETHTDTELYGGLDLGKKVDHSVLAVFEKRGEELLLRHVKVWPLESPYPSVVGYLKVLTERWRSFFRILVDVTGVGEPVADDIREADIPGFEGVNFNISSKEEMATYLKEKMQQGLERDLSGKWKGESLVHIPYPDDRGLAAQIIAQLNLERFELTRDGRVRFMHPEGAHDDIFWAICLAVFASRASPLGAGAARLEPA